MYAFVTLGPALGYIIGGQLSDVYVDFNHVLCTILLDSYN